MALRRFVYGMVGFGLVAGSLMTVSAAAVDNALTVGSARVSIAGTSNVHEWTASTTAVRITRAQAASSAWDELVKPGALEAFEIAVTANTLKSGKDGLDKNMYKALKVTEHADITFRMTALTADASGALRATGVLRIAGVEREVAFDLTTQVKDATLIVKGGLPMLMTDFGITPPKAMLGMLKTDPKVTVTFELALAAGA